MTFPGNPVLPTSSTTLSDGRTLTNDAFAAMSGGSYTEHTALTADTTLTGPGVYLCDCTAGAINLTLPEAADEVGAIIAIKTDAGGNSLTLTRAGTDTIEGSTTLTTSTQYAKLGVVLPGLGTTLYKLPGQDG